MNPKEISRALVTGASSGIGRAYALEIARRYHCDIILAARRIDRLNELKIEVDQFYRELGKTAKTVSVVQCDMSSRGGIAHLIETIDASECPLDLIVNNAGFGSVSSFVETDPVQQLSMVDLNCKAPLELIHHYFPKMVAAKAGAIINVCSTCSFQPMPFMATYGATKAFLYSLSTALSTEGASHGVQVMAHCPGPTESEFHLVSGLPTKLTYVPGMKTEPVVAQALDALEAGRSVIINGWLNYWLSYLSKWLPASVSTKIVRLILKSSV